MYCSEAITSNFSGYVTISLVINFVDVCLAFFSLLKREEKNNVRLGFLNE